MGSEFVLTAHALQVVKERAIALRWIARTLRDPDEIEPDRADPALIHHLRSIEEYGGRTLRVVHDRTASPLRVVTVFFDRRKRQNP